MPVELSEMFAETIAARGDIKADNRPQAGSPPQSGFCRAAHAANMGRRSPCRADQPRRYEQ